MPHRHGRDALRGVEGQTLDLIFQALTPVEWAELLKGPLERAAGQGNRGLARKLVKAGAQTGEALHKAVLGGHKKVVGDLLESEASINAISSAGGCTPLHVAARQGRTAMVRLLMLKGADKNAKDADAETPLLTALRHGHATAVRALLAGGADVHIRYGQNKISIIHVAAATGQVGILREVIERGADVDTVEEQKGTALHVASLWNETEAVDLLVKAGATIEARDNAGGTSLHAAAYRLSLEALAALLKHGACVNAHDDTSRTPLFWAALKAGSQGAAEVVDLLLRSGADETIIDHEGWTAADAVAAGVEEEDRLAEDVERVRKLLASAPADKAWRRRGYLVLCRAHPERMRLPEEMGMSRRTRSVVRQRRLEATHHHEGVEGTVVKEGSRAGWAGVVAHVVGLQEEGLFRTILGFL